MNKDDIDRGIGLFQLAEQYLQSISPAESISILFIEASYYGIPLKPAANLHKNTIIQKKRSFFSNDFCKEDELEMQKRLPNEEALRGCLR